MFRGLGTVKQILTHTNFDIISAIGNTFQVVAYMKKLTDAHIKARPEQDKLETWSLEYYDLCNHWDRIFKTQN